MDIVLRKKIFEHIKKIEKEMDELKNIIFEKCYVCETSSYDDFYSENNYKLYKCYYCGNNICMNCNVLCSLCKGTFCKNCHLQNNMKKTYCLDCKEIRDVVIKK